LREGGLGGVGTRVHYAKRVKPGSHMLPTYLGHGLGHRYDTCEHLSGNHKKNLSQALTAGLPVKLS